VSDTATLRPLRADEYDGWLARVKRGYADDIAAAGVDREVAEAKAEQDHEQLLTQGLATPGHHLYAVEADGEVVGSLWLSDRAGDMGPSLFVYALEVYADRRGRGYGKAAMRLAEDVARERGLGAVTLNVFGGNNVARGLYRSLGYREQAIFMRKDL
jgi:ribosomal protein S18 acetylase RimI-like enzyme